MGPLSGVRVVDLSGQIAGPYCTKLFADAGADVVKVEPPSGDPLRDRALFDFLNAGKRAVVGRPVDDHVATLLSDADLVVEAFGLEGDRAGALDVDTLRTRHPHLVVASITPYGRSGPWAGRAATEFTLQAEAGSLGIRGLSGQEPFQAGGRVTEWAAGAFAATAALAAIVRARATGAGEHVDVSMLETSNTAFANYSVVMNRLMNGSPDTPEHAFLAPAVETPSIEPTADGFVGFCTNSRQQFSDFLVMIDRGDLVDDEELAQFAGRTRRFAEWNQIVHRWTSARTTAEIVELASLFRIPVSTVNNGRTVLEHEQLVARDVFVPDASGRLRQPRPHYRIDDGDPSPPRPAPPLDPSARASFDATARDDLRSWAPDGGDLPLAGLRVLDLSAWWAGPAAAHVFATLGAEVVHVESPRRPDGMRMIGGMMAAHYPDWWEASPHFLHANTNKLDVTLDLSDPVSFELAEGLVEWCDVVFENFTPRVLEHFGLTWDRIRELNPGAILVRMPAFGLTGPWRDRPGFAQTVEQLSGLAWVTGHRADQPRIPRGPCDPISGIHAAWAALVALVARRRSGRGHHVESALAEVALNIAAEQVVEWTAHGHVLERDGNRSRLHAPQGLYPCRGGPGPVDRWLALSVATDEQWAALVAALGAPGWARDPALASVEGRRAAHDEIDEHLRAWTEQQDRDELVDALRARGVVASPVADASRLVETNPQLTARGYFERPAHPIVGPMPLPSVPFRYASVERWLRTPAPTLGQHNERVLGGILGLSSERIGELAAAGLIGDRLSTEPVEEDA